jgi:heme/copper-type cytochrome/quinol oxidase subunit 3
VSGAHESHDEHEAPKSSGIGPNMYLFLALSLVVICFQAYMVISLSGYWKQWPASDAVKVTLPAYTP